MMKFKKLNISNKEKVDEILVKGIVEIYKEVLRGDRLRFPSGTWTRPDAIENAVKCIKYLIEEKLKLSEDGIKNLINVKFFASYKLQGMMHTCFNDSPFNAINITYPNKFKIWDFTHVPNNYWTKETSIEAVRWLIEEKLKLSDEDIKEKLSIKLFRDNNLGGMLVICFNSSPFKAVNIVYPRRFKPWEFTQVPSGYWNKEVAIEATKWLIEEKLKLSDSEIKEKLSINLFKENNLSGMLRICFNNSPFEAINSTYPNKFKKSDFRSYNISNRFKP